LVVAAVLLVSAACEPQGGGGAVEIPKNASTIEFTYEDGALSTANNSPMIGERFAFDEKAGNAQLSSSSNLAAFTVSATADFRNTVFDFRKVPGDHRILTFASVTMNADFEYYVALHAENTPVVYFNSDHMAVPADLKRLSRDGPFARLKFECAKNGAPAAGTSIKLFGPSGLIAQTESNQDGKAEVSVRRLTFPTIRFSAKIPGRAAQTEGSIAIPIVGAVEELIHYFAIPIS